MSDSIQISVGYDRVAPWYDEWAWQTFWDRNEVPLVLAEVSRIGHVERAIDLGMGTGRYVAALRAVGINTFGIDVSREMATIAAHKLKGSEHLVVGDLCSHSFMLESFQLAIAARVFCHVRDLLSAFRAAAKLVSPGGALIVTELDVDHDFERTKIPTPAGKIEIATWKRGSGEMVNVAKSAGWDLDRIVKVRASDCAWLPESPKLNSVDRTSDRAIFNVFTFRRKA